ncbi:MAG: DUF2510 domain-containing protein [Actinomycetota bacterium]
MSATISTYHISTPAPAETSEVIATTVIVDRGWHADPRREHDLRFHDGAAWTEHVTHFGPVPCRGCNAGRN